MEIKYYISDKNIEINILMLSSGAFNETDTLVQGLTLQTVGIEQVFTLLVAFNSAFCTPDPLSHHPPQQAAALKAVRGRGGGPHHKVVGGGAGDRVDQRL